MSHVELAFFTSPVAAEMVPGMPTPTGTAAIRESEYVDVAPWESEYIAGGPLESEYVADATWESEYPPRGVLESEYLSVAPCESEYEEDESCCSRDWTTPAMAASVAP